jgi:hypothetical protein
VELEPGDGRRSQPAGRRDRHDESQRPEGVALEEALETRDEHEDREHCGERELEAGIEERVRIPREQNDRADEQEVPAVRHASRQPGEAAQSTSDARPDHGGLGADRQHVAADRGQRAQLTDKTRYAEQPHEQQGAAGDKCHVLSRDRQEVVEPGGTEATPQLVRQPTVLTQDDALHHGRVIPGQTSRDGNLQPPSQGVGDAADAAAPAQLRTGAPEQP